MPTPRAVREAADRANKLHAEVYPDDEEDQQEPQESPAEPPAQPEPSSPEQPEPAPAPSQEPPTAQQPASREESVDYWRDKFRTLEGKYRAEVPRLSSQLREASSRINNLEQVLASGNNQQPQNGRANEKSLVTQEEVEEYGEDFVSMMRRLAQEEAGRAVQSVAPKINQIEGQLAQNQAQTAAERVYAMLDSEVEDWRAVNRDPAFLEWLAEEDAYAGQPRSVLLRHAFDQKDGHRVLTFFKSFKAQQRPTQPPPPANPQTPPARIKARVSLEDLAGPRSNGSPAPTASGDTEAQPWTRRQIAAFYSDVRSGAFKHDPERRDRIEKSIHRASVEGLITP